MEFKYIDSPPFLNITPFFCKEENGNYSNALNFHYLINTSNFFFSGIILTNNWDWLISFLSDCISW